MTGRKSAGVRTEPAGVQRMSRDAPSSGESRVARARTFAVTVVHGDVQGVFFRDSDARCAQTPRRRGWVSNRPTAPSRRCSRDRAEAVQRVVEFCAQRPAAG